jgi:hypothetical protein
MNIRHQVTYCAGCRLNPALLLSCDEARVVHPSHIQFLCFSTFISTAHVVA